MAESDERLLEVEYTSDEEDGVSDVPLLPALTVSGRRERFILVELPVFLYFFALVTNFPVVQFYLYDYFSEQFGIPKSQNESDICRNATHSNHSSKDAEAQVQTKTSEYTMYTNFVCNFTAIIPTLLLGMLTDKFGRKFVFYITCGGLLGSQTLTIAIFYWRLSPNLLFVASLLQGLGGSWGLFLAAAFGMVADFTSPGKQRAIRVTTTEAAIALSSSLGTTTSGIWVKQMGYVWPMVFAVGLVIMSLIFVVFCVPETLVHRQHLPFTRMFFVKCFELFVKDTPNKRRFKLVVCLICFLLVVAAFVGESNFSLLYLLHQPFCWDKMQITIFNGILVLVKWVTVLTFIQLGKRCISESMFALIGSLSFCAGYLLRGLASSDLLVYISAGVSVLTELVSPMTRTMMSKSVSANEQGALFAGIGVLQMVVSSVSGIALSALYNIGLTVYLGLPYVVISGVCSLNVVLLTVLIVRMKCNPELGEVERVHEQTVN